MTMSQVAGSSVCSITRQASASLRPPEQEPPLLRRTHAWIADDDVKVADKLPGLVHRDAAPSELLDSGVGHQQFSYVVCHI